MSNKYNQKPFNSVKKFTKDAIKNASKRATQKTAEATGDLIGDKKAHKMTILSKNFSQKDEANDEIEIPKEIYISSKKITSYWWINISVII